MQLQLTGDSSMLQLVTVITALNGTLLAITNLTTQWQVGGLRNYQPQINQSHPCTPTQDGCNNPSSAFLSLGNQFSRSGCSLQLTALPEGENGLNRWPYSSISQPP